MIGLFQFFRQFVPVISKSTYHMRNLLKKSNAWSWSKECQIKFDNIILKLTTAPVLQGLSVNKDFYIYSKSSYFGTGFTVFQPSDDDPNILRVHGYGGNASTEAHRQWSVLWIELCGIYLS